MLSPIMFTEAAFLSGPAFTAPLRRRVSRHRMFETLAAMSGIDVARLGSETLREAAGKCRTCACQKACLRWLRTGSFDYSGDPRCDNAALLHR